MLSIQSSKGSPRAGLLQRFAMIKVKVTRQRPKNKVEQLQAVLQQKEAQLAKLQRVQRVLLEREQARAEQIIK